MAKSLPTIFVCSNCDSQFPKWSGRCAECGQWGTLTAVAGSSTKGQVTSQVPAGQTVKLHDISATIAGRWPMAIPEVDRVFGDGLVPGSLVLLGGDPGIGKSTLVLQIAVAMSKQKHAVLYVSGEESAPQVAQRLKRLGQPASPIEFLAETNIETILSTVAKVKPILLIVDSVQTMFSAEADSEAGSVQQVRAVTSKLMAMAKRNDISVLLVGHVTKEGTMAGPKALEHLVDVVLYLEGDPFSSHRILRAVKNRFGSTSEVGVFDMHANGLQAVPNPSQVFLSERQQAAGAVATVILEGSRPFALEIQALVNPTVFGLPRRTASGIDFNRLQVLIAVLSRRGGLKLATQDVFVNVVGGLKLQERSVDLAVCLAIASSIRDIALPNTIIALGEVGLGGEVRSVSHLERRLQEASQLGFTKAVVSTTTKTKPPAKMELVRVADIKEALNVIGRGKTASK